MASGGGLKRKSGKRCVVMFCQNTNLDGVSLHKFPRNVKTREKWDKFVRSKRQNWTPGSGHICSDHFKQDDFHDYMKNKEGFSSKLVLKNMAIPTIQTPKNKDDATPTAKRRKTTITKMNAQRVSRNIDEYLILLRE